MSELPEESIRHVRTSPSKIAFGRNHRGSTPLPSGLPRGRPPPLQSSPLALVGVPHRPIGGRSLGNIRTSAPFDSESAAREAEEIREIVTRARPPFVPEYRAFDPNHDIPVTLSLSDPSAPLQNDLRRLRELATTRILEFLTLEIATVFLSFLASLIVHEIPSVAHLADPIALRAGFLLDAHTLAVSCLTAFLRAKLAPFEAPEFRAGLVGMWTSPDDEEQQRVSSVVGALCLAVPGTDELLLPIVRGRLGAVATGLVPAHFVGPACEFLHRYHSEALHYPTDPEWFTEVCPALFASEKLPWFFVPLSELCGHYYDIFDQLPLKVVRFLLAHWPRANPAKTVHFADYVGVLIGRLTDADAAKLAPAFFRCLTEALLSGSDSSAQAVVKILARRGFLGRLKVSGLHAHKLREALEIVRESGEQLVANQARAALEKLGIVESEVLLTDGGEAREAAWLTIWEAGGERAGLTKETFAEGLAVRK